MGMVVSTDVLYTCQLSVGPIGGTAICRNGQRCVSPCHTVWSSVSIYRLSCEFSVVLSDVSVGISDDQLGQWFRHASGAYLLTVELGLL